MKRQIMMTEKDRVKLQKVIKDILLTDLDGTEHVKGLDEEMEHAIYLPSDKIPADVITMQSRVKLVFGDGEEEEYTLVYPDEADMSENRISVLSPVGTAILGYREGDTVVWNVPDGSIDILIKSVVYQPEAAGED